MNLQEISIREFESIQIGQTENAAARNVHSQQDILAKIMDMEDEINNDIDALVDLKREIKRTIERVENPEYLILLELRYLCFKRWEEIAVMMNYNIRHIYRLHDEALEKLKVPDTQQ